MSDIEKYTQQNRRAWNEIADVRHKKWPPAQFFAEGGSILDPPVLTAADDVTGQTLLHLQCATGEDTLSWAVMGAHPTGLILAMPKLSWLGAKRQKLVCPYAS